VKELLLFLILTRISQLEGFLLKKKVNYKTQIISCLMNLLIFGRAHFSDLRGNTAGDFYSTTRKWRIIK